MAVQLHAQEAKAWARLGNQRNVYRSLENGRILLDSLAYPERPDNHFVIDPDKFDYYAMDCYRLVGDDTLAEMYARETIRKITTPDGRVLAPMRMAESELTLGVVAARQGDPTAAVDYGMRALGKERQCTPSLIMVGAELAAVLAARYPHSVGTREFQAALQRAGEPQLTSSS